MDAGVSEQKTVTLLIKSPNQTYEVQTVEGVCLSWTVRDLKMHLATVYPTRPAVSDQRLIYAGKLLPDHLHIKDLFRPSDSVPTLHLVCALRNPPQGQPDAKTKATTAPPRPDELRQRRSTSAAPAQTRTPEAPSGAAAGPGTPAVTQPAFPTYSLYSPQQLLWLQHVYARQYYMQYHAALAAAAGSVPSAPASTPGHYPPVPAHQVPVPAPLANQNPINNLPANQNPAQDGAFINAGEANQNMRMNAQGGPLMEDEEDAERDWLDWMYTAARLGVLLMIVYFNSNLSRFLLVMSTLLLMYLHTAGWFPFRRRVQVQGPDHLQAPEVQLNQQNQNRNPDPADEPTEEAVAAAAAAAADQSDEPGPMTAVLVPPHRVSLMWTAWVFFKTFFSSLIPEVPQGVAN